MRRKKIKARIREVEGNIRFEEGRLSEIDARGEDETASKTARANIRNMNAVVATLKEVLNS